MAGTLTNFLCEPDADNPGWSRWRIADVSLFNEAVLGKLLVRKESDSHTRCRMFPQTPLHVNSGRNIHGGITLAFADVSLFAALYMLRGIDAGRSVTLDMTAQFIAAGDPSRPLDAEVELLRETRRLAFLRGLVVQEDDLIASFTGTVRKPSGA